MGSDDVPMPRDLTEDAVAEWLHVSSDPFNESRCPWGGLYNSEREPWLFVARAVLAWCEARVREAVELTMRGAFAPLKGHIVHDYNIDGYVARVMGRKEVGRGE